MSVQPFSKAVLLAVLLAAVGCDPSGDSSFAGIEGTGSPTTVGGSVTAYGSIYVNGVHISLDGAEIYVEGEPATEQDLELGMVVEATTNDALSGGDQAVAQTVRYQRSLRGAITQVVEANDVRKVLQVLGQTLIVHDDAVFDGLNFEALEAGTMVDVSGFVDAEGRLAAARVAAPSDSEADVRGELRDLDSTQSRFALGELSVDYSEALFEDGERDQLLEGTRVRLLGGEMEEGVFRAHRVRILDEDERSESGETSREGVIQSVESGAQFTLAGVPVDASDAAIEGGEQSHLRAGLRVVVDGTVNSGVLQARTVRLVPPGVDRVRAEVDSVDSETGELVLLGEAYTSTRLTAFEDLAQGNRFINMAELRQGDTVELYARPVGDVRLVTRIKRVDADSQVELRGPVTAIDVDAPSIRVMNVDVVLEGDAAAQILADLRQGDRVRVRGTMSGSAGTAIITASDINLSSVPEGLADCPQPIQDACEDLPDVDIDLGELTGPRYRF